MTSFNAEFERSFPVRFGIRLKVVLVLVTVLMVTVTIGTWTTVREQKLQTLAEIDQRGKDISRMVAKSVSFSVVGYDYHTIQLLLDNIVKAKDINYARVLSVKGNTMGEAGVLPASNAEQPSTALFKQAIEFESRNIGTVIVGMDTRHAIEALNSRTSELLVRRFFVIAFIAIAEFFALSIVIIRPIRRLSETLSKGITSEGRQLEGLPVTTHDELGQLASQFNSLKDALNRSNFALQSKIESADKKLIQSNEQLKLQSEELIKINEEFRKLAITDPLTGLFNRRYFERAMKDEMALALRHGDKHCVLLIDIDNFKNINDTYGHLEGDRVLQKFADTLKEQLRSADILSRMGGEEFVVLCKRVESGNVFAIAEKFRKRIENIVFDFGVDTLHITASIGAAIFPKDPDDTTENVIHEADEALYYCKRNGRNRSAFFDDIKGEILSISNESSSNVRNFPERSKDKK